MEELGINYVAVLVATVATFFVGYVWYTPLFGKAWARENKIDTSGGATSGQLAKGLIMNIIGCFLMAYVFAHNNAAWTFVPGMAEMSSGATIANAAIFTWLGFYVPVDMNAVAWEGKSWKLFFINTGYHLTMLIVAATILVTMK
jgi:hypothetical protein